ncbi:glycosyltransferase family 4 protein [Nocardioides sp. SYSU D00065]|uniref:glycosyltransferase family 4 protein n=1 Tax=Nocardioides sp. SYSU D00065 TaxID=2817378 RepID=UPI001B339B98|nr:glycosyltransferase family 4 protein [Nocardioides sp. SYSU D00065]
MTDRRPSGGGNLRRGLRGSIDLPSDTIEDPARVVVAGWTFHEHADVVLVVVFADGRLVGTVEREIDRPDVASVHGAASARSGWSVTVALGPVGGQVTLSAQALVAVAGTDDQAARTVLLPFAERLVAVRDGGRVRGAVDLPDVVGPGTFLVSGTADITPALARVEVALDGGAAVLARTSLPSAPERGAGPESAVRGFSATLELPAGAREADVRVTAVATDGTRAALPTTPVRVAEEPPRPSDERTRVNRERFEQHVAAQHRAFPGPRSGCVLVAAHDLGIGGAQGYLDDLMNGLHQHGVTFCVVAGSDGPLLERIETTYGAPVLVVGQVPSNAELLETQIRLVADFAIEHGAVACLANTLVTFPAVLAASRLELPSTWAIHESFSPPIFWHEFLGAPANPAILAAMYEALSVCEAVLFEAEATRQVYRHVVPSESAALVPYGLDIEPFDRALATTSRGRARDELGIPHDERVLVCVGSVEPRKGQLPLARAFARLDSELRAGASLHLIGASDNSYSNALRDYVRDAALDNVHVVPADPDILRWYAAADVLVSASDVESMPRTMLEAMLAGRPVAATAAFGVGELVENDVSGWLCEPGDLHELSGVLRKAVTADVETLARFGTAARAHVASRHSATGFVGHVLDWLHRLDSAGTTS